MVTEYEWNVRREIELKEYEAEIYHAISRLDLNNSQFNYTLSYIREMYKEYQEIKEETYRDAIMDDQFNSRKDGY